jgi:hypothetical protein
MTRTVLLLLLFLATDLTGAVTTIYRCGPGGKEFSQRPCADGTIVEGTDGRTAAQRAAATRVVEQERRKAAELERERRAREAKDKPAVATGIDGLARPADDAASAADRGKADKKTARVKDKPSKDFVAVKPVAKK